MWYFLFRTLLIGPALRLATRPEVTGMRHLPRRGPAILACNHLAVSDSLVLALVSPRPLTFIAKSEYFTTPGLRGRVRRWFFTASGQIPVDRSGNGAGAAALRAAQHVLHDNRVWAVHPEGTRSPDGRIHRGRTGVARVAFATGAPLVPAVISGTERVSPRGARLWRPAKVTVRVGEPVDLSDLSPQRYADARVATDRLMHALAELSGREYVDRYAA